MIRDDISTKLIHLTRDTIEIELDDPDRTIPASDKFMNIVKTETLLGGTGGIRGGFRCVCFSEAPIGKLAQLFSVYTDPNKKFRYAPLGVMVDKKWLFYQGGRPVIYQPEEEYDCLPDSHKYRHVRYEPHDDPDKNKDFTWEREWRIQKDELKLEPEKTTLVVPTRQWERKFIEEVLDSMKRISMVGSYAFGDITDKIFYS